MTLGLTALVLAVAIGLGFMLAALLAMTVLGVAVAGLAALSPRGRRAEVGRLHRLGLRTTTA